MYSALAGPVPGLYERVAENARAASGWSGRAQSTRKGVKTVSEKEKRIMETLAKVVRESNEHTKDYLLGWAEGAAYAVSGAHQTEERAGT